MTPEQQAAFDAQLAADGGAEGSGESAEQQQEQQGEEQKGYNPNWDEAWEDVPEPIKERQKAVFDKWDRNNAKRLTDYQQYQEFVDAEIDPEDLKTAYGLLDSVMTDPRKFWDDMGANYGFTAAEQKQIKDAADAAGVDLDSLEDPTMKEVAELKRIILEDRAAAQAQSQEAQQRQAAQANTAAIEQEFEALGAKYNLDDDDLIEIGERAILNANLGRPATAERAYLDVMEARDKFAAKAGLRKAAPKLNGGGGQANVVTQEQAKTMTNEDRKAAAMALAKQLASQD